MSGIVGLGFDMGTVRLDSARTSVISQPSQPLLPTNTHPAYVPHLPPRSHRGPRSLGVGGRFVSAPSATLPPSLYDRTPNNPLSLLNSPQLDLGLAEFSPTQHLRQKMKTRSGVAPRGFGLGLDDPLPTSTMLVANDIPSSSPTIGASPTLGTGSPIMSPQPQMDHSDLLVPSIAALSVILGLLVLGVAGWAGLTYRRRRVRSRGQEHRHTGEDGDFDEDQEGGLSNYRYQTEKDPQMFSASNVVEKGLKPRSGSLSTGTTLRPTSIFFGNGKNGRASPPNGGNGSGHRRVSFVDQMHVDDVVHFQGDAGGRRASALPLPRVMTASLMEVGIESVNSDEEFDEDEGRISARSSIAVSIAPTLEPIEEEESLTSSSTRGSLREREANIMETPRRDSVTSTTSAASSAYTTASARSSISSLSALSILSTSFPQTPHALSTPPPLHFLPHAHPRSHFPGPSDSPTPVSKMQTRRARAQSQGVMAVKHDLLRIAVGRTMSLQPSKEVIKALRTMTASADIAEMPMGGVAVVLGNTEEEEAIEAEEMRLAALMAEKLVADAEASIEVDQSDLSDEETYMEEVERVQDQGRRRVPRSTSFPAKLLSRGRSQRASSTGSPARRSEVMSGGYLKVALRAFRGEDADHNPGGQQRDDELVKTNSRESIRGLVERQAQLELYLSHLHMIQHRPPPPPPPPPLSGQPHIPHMSQQALEDDERMVIEEHQLESDPYISAPSSNVSMMMESDVQDVDCDSIWDPDGYAADLGAFDEYYLHFEGDEEDNVPVEEEEKTEDLGKNGYPTVAKLVPHIRVTSH
ncbi:hypothetical protein IAR55_002387 [Kwoniella newhampshirensis]|uniref:Uncharacterized protein n=1 Tax=Kwoniella newhampshirensis TaxID=1651941 RepID=A0AAW0Z0K6_9TREE